MYATVSETSTKRQVLGVLDENRTKRTKAVEVSKNTTLLAKAAIKERERYNRSKIRCSKTFVETESKVKSTKKVKSSPEDNRRDSHHSNLSREPKKAISYGKLPQITVYPENVPIVKTLVPIIKNESLFGAKRRSLKKQYPPKIRDPEPLLSSEYHDEIIAHVRQVSVKRMPANNYMDYQPDLQWSMRDSLVGWLAQIHIQFKLTPDTLFISINLLDRFLSLKHVTVPKLQLAGVAAFWIASKYEEIMAPSVNDLVYMGGGAYNHQELINAERFILSTMKYEVDYPNPLYFLRHCYKKQDEIFYLAQYFCHLTITNPIFLGHQSSKIGSAALLLAKKVAFKEWEIQDKIISGYSEEQLTPCAQQMLEQGKIAHLDENLRVIFKYFSTEKYKQVSMEFYKFLRQRNLITQ